MRGGKTFEITLKDEKQKEKVMDRVRVKGALVLARDITNDDMVVPFITLPVYMEDSTILSKL